MRIGCEAREVARAAELGDRRIGVEVRLERHRADDHLLVELDAHAVEDARVQRLEEMVGAQGNAEFLEHAVVDQHRAQERRLGLEIGGQRAGDGGIGKGTVEQSGRSHPALMRARSSGRKRPAARRGCG